MKWTETWRLLLNWNRRKINIKWIDKLSISTHKKKIPLWQETKVFLKLQLPKPCVKVNNISSLLIGSTACCELCWMETVVLCSLPSAGWILGAQHDCWCRGWKFSASTTKTSEGRQFKKKKRKTKETKARRNKRFESIIYDWSSGIFFFKLITSLVHFPKQSHVFE